MKPGDLVRYKHDKSRVGVLLELREGRQDKYFVLWNHAVQGKSTWCVQSDWVQVKRDEWEDP